MQSMQTKQATRDNLRLSIQIQIKYQLMQKNISIKALSGKKAFLHQRQRHQIKSNLNSPKKREKL